MSPLGGGAAGMDALTEYGEAAPTDRSVFGLATVTRGTIDAHPRSAEPRTAQRRSHAPIVNMLA